jgi:hypothetical protein
MNRRSCLLFATLAVTLLGLAGCGRSSTSKQSTGASTDASTAPGSADASTDASTAPATTSAAATSTQPQTSSMTASASSGTGRTVTASAGGVSATLRGSTHAPKVGRPWPLHFTVTRGAHAVNASVSYEYLFGGQVVARRSHYTFDGHFSDVFKWPSSAVGYPLTFRAVIVSEGATIDLEYPVQVIR